MAPIRGKYKFLGDMKTTYKAKRKTDRSERKRKHPSGFSLVLPSENIRSFKDTFRIMSVPTSFSAGLLTVKPTAAVREQLTDIAVSPVGNTMAKIAKQEYGPQTSQKFYDLAVTIKGLSAPKQEGYWNTILSNYSKGGYYEEALDTLVTEWDSLKSKLTGPGQLTILLRAATIAPSGVKSMVERIIDGENPSKVLDDRTWLEWIKREKNRAM